MHFVLLTPIGVGVPGNGLSQRCGLWADALAELGTVTRVVVPVVGPVDNDPAVLAAVRTIERSPLLPTLAQGVTRELGLTMGNHVHRGIGPVDVVVGVRSYMGEMCLGVQAATGARLVIDFDDDDIAFFRATGHPDEAERFATLIDRLSSAADTCTSAQGFGDTELVPNGVVVPEVIHRSRNTAASPSVLFLGNMGYQPNRAAAEWLINDIAPEIMKRLPDAEVTIAGPGSEEFPHGRGFVDDLDALLANTDVFVAPLREGSGTRIKILDAWAHGVPVVSTHTGAEGLAAVDKSNILLADDPESIAIAVAQLCNDPDLADRLAVAGREVVAESYSRARVIDTVRRLIGRVTTKGGVGNRESHVVARAIDTIHLAETDDGLVVLDTATGSVHELDPTATVIFSLIDGKSTDEEIAREIKVLYGLDETPIDSVVSAVCDLVQVGLVFRVRLHDQGLGA